MAFLSNYSCVQTITVPQLEVIQSHFLKIKTIIVNNLAANFLKFERIFLLYISIIYTNVWLRSWFDERDNEKRHKGDLKIKIS